MRRPVIAGNWKMFKHLGEAVNTAVALKPLVANATHCEVVIAPVFVHLKSVADRLEGSNIRVSAQDCAPVFEQSAHTGEVSAEMLWDIGCRYVIIGHSERRQHYSESDELINLKVRSGVRGGLTSILCVGETLSEREAGGFKTVVETQLRRGLEGLTTADLQSMIIAYEPVWAIGTGKTASPEQAQEMHGHLRSVLAESQGKQVAEQVRILYGGSVKPDNIRSLMDKPDIDGALVGGASLQAESFAAIVNYL